MKNLLKKISTFLLFSFCSISLLSCGKKPEPETQNSIQAEIPSETKTLEINSAASSLDIVSSAEELFRFDMQEETGFLEFLGTQFYRGEPVQLWMEILDEEGNPLSVQGFPMTHLTPDDSGVMDTVTANIYMYKADGSRELLVEELPKNDPHEPLFIGFSSSENAFSANRMMDYIDSGWYADENGGCYCWWEFMEGNDGVYSFMKLNSSGEVLYDVLLDSQVTVADIIQLPDGRMYLVVDDSVQKVKRISEFDPDTGEIDEEGIIVKSPGSDTYPYTYNMKTIYGTSDDGRIYLLISPGIYELSLSDGQLSEVLPFAGTTYSSGDSSIDMTALTEWHSAALRSLNDGDFMVLWDTTSMYSDSLTLGVAERLHLSESDRNLVTIRGSSFTDWMKRQAARFNRSNSEWQVVLEEYASSNAVDLEEYARLTSIQLASGGGPDMLYGNFMDDYLGGMIDKGALLDLKPLMDETGLHEDDFLPLVFDVWREDSRIFGITAESRYPLLYTIDAEVLGGDKEPDIETLVSALLAWEEGGALYAFDSPEIILRWFLQGSGDLFGMLDWEQGSCDLSGGLLEKLLEVSKKYGYDERYNHHNLIRSTRLADICQYDSAAELAGQGRVVCGVLFEDRCRGTVTSEGTLAISSSSKAGRGAWEFLRFLLSDDAQSKTSSFPVKRSLLKDWTAQQAARTEADENGITINVSYIDRGELVKDQKTYTPADMTEERTEEYLDALENIRAFPIRCAPVLDIICQEAEDYFSGGKSIGEVIDVIENRIGLYLAERH